MLDQDLKKLLNEYIYSHSDKNKLQSDLSDFFSLNPLEDNVSFIGDIPLRSWIRQPNFDCFSSKHYRLLHIDFSNERSIYIHEPKVFIFLDFPDEDLPFSVYNFSCRGLTQVYEKLAQNVSVS